MPPAFFHISFGTPFTERKPRQEANKKKKKTWQKGLDLSDFRDCHELQSIIYQTRVRIQIKAQLPIFSAGRGACH